MVDVIFRIFKPQCIFYYFYKLLLFLVVHFCIYGFNTLHSFKYFQQLLFVSPFKELKNGNSSIFVHEQIRQEFKLDPSISRETKLTVFLIFDESPHEEKPTK